MHNVMLVYKIIVLQVCSFSYYHADGRSHDNVVTPSNNLKNAGVIVYAVGIGRVAVNELRDISSDPDDEHVFLLNSFRDAAGFVDFLSVTTCDSKHRIVLNI